MSGEGEVPSFPFDVALCVDTSETSGKRFAEQLYNDLCNDGLFVCLTPSGNGQRTFVGIGASDRLLHAFVRTTRMPEHVKSRPTKGSDVDRIYAQCVRQRILWQIFAKRKYGEYPMSLSAWVEKGLILDYFPLHDNKKAKRIWTKTFEFYFAPGDVYLENLTEYLGEETGMYFHWLRQYTLQSVPIAFVGIFAGVVQIVNNFDSWVLPVFAVFTLLWATVCNEMWKRKEKLVAHRMGTLGMERVAPVRHEFRGDPRPLVWSRTKMKRGVTKTTLGRFQIPIQHTYASEVVRNRSTSAAEVGDKASFRTEKELFEDEMNALPDNVTEQYFATWKRYVRFVVTGPALLSLCVCVVVTIYLVDFLRNYWADPKTGRLSAEHQLATSVINAVVIVVLNQVYPVVAKKVTQWENFRTQTDHDNAYIVKMWTFLFVNSYFPIFLTAFQLQIFDQKDLDKKTSQARLQELFFQILSVFVVNVVIGNVRAFVVPMVAGKFSVAAHDMMSGDANAADPPTQHSGTQSSHARESREFERQYALSEYVSSDEKYAEMAMLFGYVCLFAVIFPFGPVFLLLNNIIDQRIDVFRFLQQQRRGTARRVESIGYWGFVFQSIAIMSIVTNALLACFTSDALVDWYGLDDTSYARISAFVTLEHIGVFVMFALRFLIDDTPAEVKRAHAITAYKMAKEKGFLMYDPIATTEPTSSTPTPRSQKVSQDAYKGITFSMGRLLVRDEATRDRIRQDMVGLQKRGAAYGVVHSYPNPVPLAVDVMDENIEDQRRDEVEEAAAQKLFLQSLGISS